MAYIRLMDVNAKAYKLRVRDKDEF
jgi:hypothetical protein